MKKINLLLIVFVLYAFSAKAQEKEEYAFLYQTSYLTNFNSYEYMLDYVYRIGYKTEKEKIKTAHVKEMTMTEKKGAKEWVGAKFTNDARGNCTSAVFNNKKGKTKRQFVFTYSPENLVLSKAMLNGKGKELRRVTFSYNKDSLQTEAVLYKRGKETQKNTYAYNKFKQYTEQAFYRKGEIKKKIISYYDSTRIKESEFYKNGNADYSFKWVYTYYSDKSRKTSTIFKCNGKVKYTWNYDCKPEGELMSKHKDSTLICQNKEYDKDSNITYTYRQFNEKGKPEKVVSTWSKNRKIMQYATYRENDIPVSFFKYNMVTSEYEQQIYYNKKGKETFKIINTFDNDNNLTEVDDYNKGSLNAKTVRQFNSSKLVTSETNYKKNNKVINASKYDYLFF